MAESAASRGGIMEIHVRINELLAERKLSAGELAKAVGITLQNLSVLKNDRAKAIRFSTLSGLCRALNCQPGDLLEFIPAIEEPEAQ